MNFWNTKAVRIIPFLFLFGACQNQRNPTLSDAIVGAWSIDEINESDDYLICFTMNIIRFDSSICKLPTSNGNCDSLNAEDSGGIWFLSKTGENPYCLTIGSRNQFFSGKYTVVIEDDSTNKLMKMHLLLNRVDISLRKGYVNYDEERDWIKRLAKETSLPPNWCDL